MNGVKRVDLTLFLLVVLSSFEFSLSLSGLTYQNEIRRPFFVVGEFLFFLKFLFECTGVVQCVVIFAVLV